MALWAGVTADLIDRTKLDGFGFLFAPAKPVVAAEEIQDEPGPA